MQARSVLTALPILALAVASFAAEPVQGDKATVEDLTRQYLSVAFEWEGMDISLPLVRWTKPIRWRLVSKGKIDSATSLDFRNNVFRHFQRVSELTGLEVREAASNTGANVELWFDRRTVLNNQAVEFGDTDGLDGTCKANFSLEGATLETAAHKLPIRIFIPSDMPREYILHCITVETTQALGLAGDTPFIKPSIYSDFPVLVNKLPWWDEVIVRTHYDPRLKPGMSKDEAAPLVPAIITRNMREMGKTNHD